jgi:hypothetical protein
LAQSVDVGVLGEDSGAGLMTDGVEIASSPASRAHVIELVPGPPVDPGGAR